MIRMFTGMIMKLKIRIYDMSRMQLRMMKMIIMMMMSANKGEATLRMSPLWMSCTSMVFSEIVSLFSSSVTRVASVACRDISLARASEVFPWMDRMM